MGSQSLRFYIEGSNRQVPTDSRQVHNSQPPLAGPSVTRPLRSQTSHSSRAPGTPSAAFSASHRSATIPTFCCYVFGFPSRRICIRTHVGRLLKIGKIGKIVDLTGSGTVVPNLLPASVKLSGTCRNGHLQLCKSVTPGQVSNIELMELDKKKKKTDRT